MKLKLFGFVFALMLVFPVASIAQSNYSASELDTLVANIALYPDQLLIHVLDASTYGEQIPSATAWANSHKHLKGESLAAAIEQANLPYEPCIQALLPFPTVLAMLDKYKTWADQLGDAVTSQKEKVMDAVQRLRKSAYNHGHLSSNEQVNVEVGENVVIVPVKTEYVYVPVYNPRVVYYVHADGYTHVTYGSGVWLGTWFGEWGWGSCWFDWGPRVIYVRNTRWYAHRPIPRHPRHYRPAPRPKMAPVVPGPASRAVSPAPASRVSSPAPASRIVTPAPSPAPARVVPQPKPAPSKVVPRDYPFGKVESNDDEDRQHGRGDPTNPRPMSPKKGGASSRGGATPAPAPRGRR